MSLAEHIHSQPLGKPEKTASAHSRARTEARRKLGKIVKKAAQIADLLTHRDQLENLRVIREAKRANHVVYDGKAKEYREFPDHKTRLAATALDLAYREGRPRERSENLHVHATTDDFNELVDLIRSSKGASRRLSGLLPENVAKAQDVVTDKPENDPTKSDQNSDATSGDDLGT